MKLKWIINKGRFKNTITGKSYNLKSGTRVLRGTTHIYYTYRGTRMFINDKDFYDNYKKID